MNSANYEDIDIMDIIVDKGGLTTFLAELADVCEKEAEGDVRVMPDTDIGRSYRQFWLTASAELLALQQKLEKLH